MIDINYILSKYPWDPKWLKLSTPIDSLWEFELKVSREDIWPYLIDTSSFNYRMGLPKFKYEEIEGRLHGTAKQVGIQLEWEEVPWEWEYLKEIGNARIYTKGFTHYLRSRFLLEPYGETRSRLYIYFGFIPKNIFMRKLLQISIPNVQKSFDLALKDIQREIQVRANAAYESSNLIQNPTSFVGDVQWLHPEKLDQEKPNLIKSGIKEEVIDSIYDYIRNTGDNDLYRIRVKEISKKLKIDFEEALKLFLYGCRHGLFTLSWDVICPHCRGVRTSLQKLGELPEKDNCEACGIDFETTGQTGIEVTFHIHPSIRIVEKQFFCAAEPATKKHILLSKSVPPGKAFSSHLLLNHGVFRLRKKGENQFKIVEVDEKHVDREIVWLDEDKQNEIFVKSKPNLVFQNESADPITIVLEERREDQFSLRPKELFNFNEFRDIFSEEAIATNLQLDIGVQTLLFTDIVGSTQFYETVGDHGAFLQVREHFIKAYAIVKKEKGTIIKTIGDAIMASFPSPVYALKAGKEMQEWFHPENKHTPVRIRVSIHTGNCLAVNLNSNIDYFGNTVNYAAKMQNKTNSGEISISERVFRDRELRNYLKEQDIKLRKIPFPLSWTDRTDSIYIWNV